MVNLIIWIVFGALAGWVISLLYGTGEKQNSKRYILLGIGGAVIGGFCIQIINGQSVTGFNDMSVIFSVIGSLLLIGALKTFST